MMIVRTNKRRAWLAVSLAVCLVMSLTRSATAQEHGEVVAGNQPLHDALMRIFFYPFNRIMDLNDIVQFGVAGSLGIGAEVAVTEKFALGGYYVAKEKGIAYHGHRNSWDWNPSLMGSPFYGGEQPLMWLGKGNFWQPSGEPAPLGWFGLDAPTAAVVDTFTSPTHMPVASSSNFYLLPSTIMKLLPGTGNKQRVHHVDHGYATWVVGDYRLESSDDPKLHFKRFHQTTKVSDLIEAEVAAERQAKDNVMTRVESHMDKHKEAALRAEAVLGIVHPYIAVELYEALDFLGGIAMLDIKEDDWHPTEGRDKARKFGRGLSNIAGGFLEVPRAIQAVDDDHGGFAALTYGATRGLWRFFMRSAVVGPWEVVTFPTMTDPVIEPEFPFQPGETETDWRVH